MGSAKIDKGSTKCLTKLFLCGQFLVKVFENSAGSLPAIRQNRCHVVWCPDEDILPISGDAKKKCCLLLPPGAPKVADPCLLFMKKFNLSIIIAMWPRHTELWHFCQCHKGSLPQPFCLFFFNIVKKPLTPPPPPRFEHVCCKFFWTTFKKVHIRLSRQNSTK